MPKMPPSLKAWRLSHGWTQAKAASEVGLKLRQYGSIERGQSKITERTMLLVRAIGIGKKS